MFSVACCKRLVCVKLKSLLTFRRQDKTFSNQFTRDALTQSFGCSWSKRTKAKQKTSSISHRCRKSSKTQKKFFRLCMSQRPHSLRLHTYHKVRARLSFEPLGICKVQTKLHKTEAKIGFISDPSLTISPRPAKSPSKLQTK